MGGGAVMRAGAVIRSNTVYKLTMSVLAFKNHHEYTTNAVTLYYEPLRINRNQHAPLRTPRSVANRAWFVAFVEDFLTVKNMHHEHQCPEPTQSVENHIQMCYVSLRMCHEWRIKVMCKPSIRYLIWQSTRMDV